MKYQIASLLSRNINFSSLLFSSLHSLFIVIVSIFLSCIVISCGGGGSGTPTNIPKSATLKITPKINTYQLRQKITPIHITVSTDTLDGSGFNFAVTPALPAGLNLVHMTDATSATITGTPTVFSDATMFTITFTATDYETTKETFYLTFTPTFSLTSLTIGSKTITDGNLAIISDDTDDNALFTGSLTSNITAITANFNGTVVDATQINFADHWTITIPSSDVQAALSEPGDKTSLIVTPIIGGIADDSSALNLSLKYLPIIDATETQANVATSDGQVPTAEFTLKDTFTIGLTNNRHNIWIDGTRRMILDNGIGDDLTIDGTETLATIELNDISPLTMSGIYDKISRVTGITSSNFGNITLARTTNGVRITGSNKVNQDFSTGSAIELSPNSGSATNSNAIILNNTPGASPITTPIAQVNQTTMSKVTYAVKYVITINGTDYTYTSPDTGATVAEVVAGLVTAINNSAVTCIDLNNLNTTVQCTANTPGTAFTYSVRVEK